MYTTTKFPIYIIDFECVLLNKAQYGCGWNSFPFSAQTKKMITLPVNRHLHEHNFISIISSFLCIFSVSSLISTTHDYLSSTHKFRRRNKKKNNWKMNEFHLLLDSKRIQINLMKITSSLDDMWIVSWGHLKRKILITKKYVFNGGENVVFLVISNCTMCFDKSVCCLLVWVICFIHAAYLPQVFHMPKRNENNAHF